VDTGNWIALGGVLVGLGGVGVGWKAYRASQHRANLAGAAHLTVKVTVTPAAPGPDDAPIQSLLEVEAINDGPDTAYEVFTSVTDAGDRGGRQLGDVMPLLYKGETYRLSDSLFPSEADGTHRVWIVWTDARGPQRQDTGERV
jgi:hypothetical protein